MEKEDVRVIYLRGYTPALSLERLESVIADYVKEVEKVVIVSMKSDPDWRFNYTGMEKFLIHMKVLTKDSLWHEFKSCSLTTYPYLEEFREERASLDGSDRLRIDDCRNDHVEMEYLSLKTSDLGIADSERPQRRILK